MKTLVSRFFKDEVGCDGHRIRPHRCRHLGRHHHGRRRPRHQAELDLHQREERAELSFALLNRKGPGVSGAFFISGHLRA